MVSSVKAGELLFPEGDVTDSRVLSPARLTVVDEKVLLVWTSAWAVEEEASPCLRVVDGRSRGGLSVSVCVRAESEPSSVLTESWFLLSASVVPPAAGVRGSVDRPRVSRDLVLISV